MGLCSSKVCMSRNGLEMCVQMKGSCELSDLISGAQDDVKMDLFYVSVRNGSTRRVDISPLHFYGITRQGLAVTLDAPLYESIEWRTKLTRTRLGPQGESEGYLFFPCSMGHVDRLIYAGEPFFEIQLF